MCRVSRLIKAFRMMVEDADDAKQCRSDFLYVVSAHRPTAVTHSLTAAFTSPDEINLIVVKSTRIEIHLIRPEGLEMQHDIGMYGRVAAIQKMRPMGHRQDLLFVLTDSYNFCMLSYEPTDGKIVTRARGNVRDRIGRRTDLGPLGIVDPQCRLVGLYLYDGLFKVIPVAAGGGMGEAFNVRLEELQVLDVQFLYGTRDPTMCVLLENTNEQRYFKTYRLNLEDKDYVPLAMPTASASSSSSSSGGAASSTSGAAVGPTFVGATAHKLVPVPMPIGGLLVIAEDSVAHYNIQTGQMRKQMMDPKEILSIGKIDQDGSAHYRYLLGDSYGGLHVMVLQHTEGAVDKIDMQLLGKTSITETLTYLDNGVVFAGSVFGDSHLIKLRTSAGEDGAFFEVLDTHPNLGPIVDMSVVDLDRHGQCQVVTCSGAYGDGTLRIISNGIGIEKQATIDLPGIKGMWSLPPSFAAEHDKFLVQTFVGETRVLGIEDEEMGEFEISGFAADARSLFCAVMLGDFFVQVTEADVRLVSCRTLALQDRWAPSGGSTAPGPAQGQPVQNKITVAKGNPTQIVVTLAGGILVELGVSTAGGRAALREVARKQLEYEVACLDLNPVPVSLPRDEVESKAEDGEDGTGMDVDPPGGGTTRLRAELLAVGMWTEVSVRIFKLGTLEQLARVPLGGEVLPRSLLFEVLDSQCYLLAALGDGNVLSFKVASSGAVSDRKKVSLGRKPITLSTFRTKGQTHIFAASDRPTVVHSSNAKLLYSNVNLEEVTTVCSFNAESFPDCLAIATEEDLSIGNIDSVQKLHIQTVPLGEQPRRIAHLKSAGAFCVCTTRVERNAGGVDVEHNFVRLIDDRSFEVLHSERLDPFECAAVVITHTSVSGEGYFVVGTAYVLEDEPEPSKGRMLVFGVERAMGQRKLKLFSQLEADGAVYSMGIVGDCIVAGVNAQVIVYDLQVADVGAGVPRGAGQFTLKEVCKHEGHILALYISARGNKFVVGDLMKSVTLMEFRPTEKLIVELARDYNANWMSALTMLDDQTCIGAENSFNLFTLRQNAEAMTDEERGRLEVVGQFHVGQFINKFAHGSLVMQPVDADESTMSARPSLIFGSVDGGVGVVITLSKENFLFLSRLQRALEKVVKGVGGFNHAEWRAFQNDRKTGDSKGTIDGDLIETLLDLSSESLAQTTKIMNEDLIADGEVVTQEELVQRVEALFRIH